MPRTRRYNSEYKSHYKKFSSKRPNTVKGEITRSIIPYDQQSNISTPRAGLLSTQLGVIHEPPIQRKKIVPYEKNHNIFPTGTTKEMSERQWLKTENTARESEQKNYHRSPSQPKKRQESPLLKAEKKLLQKTTPGTVAGYNYVSDGLKRKSTYTQDFEAKGRKSRDKTYKDHSTPRKPKPAVGGTKTGISPDRLPAAGLRTMTSYGDKRLLKPSDNSQYMKSPDRESMRIYDSEYRSRFNFIDGNWIESPELQGRPSPNYTPSRTKQDWFNEVINRRNEAYGYANNARGTHFSRKELDYQNRLSAHQNNADNKSVSEYSSTASSKNSKNKKNYSKKKESSEKPHDYQPREAWAKPPSSPTESKNSFITSCSDVTPTENGQFFLERGRSPTPELRETGQSRRHHYDMTTNILNEKLEKSLTLSHNEKPSPALKKNKDKKVKLPSSQDGSYVPPRSKNKREEDAMSEISMSSRASTASQTLQRARNRQNFWSE